MITPHTRSGDSHLEKCPCMKGARDSNDVVPFELEGAAPPAPHLSFRRSYPAHHPVDERSNHSIVFFLLSVPEVGRQSLRGRMRWPSCAKPGRRPRSAGRMLGADARSRAFVLCACYDAPVPLQSLVGILEIGAARHWPRSAECPFVERDFWDRQLRQSDSYRAKWNYVRQNPVRKGLVDREEAWPFQGEENQLRCADDGVAAHRPPVGRDFGGRCAVSASSAHLTVNSQSSRFARRTT